MEKNRAEKLKEARSIVLEADANPTTIFETECLAGAGYFLLDEVDRLSGLEAKVLGMMKETSDEITELNADYEAASEADCDFEVFERIERLLGQAHAKLKVLGSLLG